MSNKIEEKNLQTPSPFPKNPSAEIMENLQSITEVFQRIEEETADIAEMIFEYLINSSDDQITNGTIPLHPENNRINSYIKILNRLFLLSRSRDKSYVGGFRVINRNTVKNLDKKTFAICMCHDGGVSLDILCDIVNTENQARTPSVSPVKVTVKQAFVAEKNHQR